jgi:hypothetical protein
MPSYPRTVLLALNLITISACAHPPKGSSEVSGSEVHTDDVVIQPRMLGSKTQLMLRSRGVRPQGTIEIPVNASGIPDVFGMRFIGTFDDLTRQDLSDWIGQSMFAPAKRNGLPAAGVFKMTFR